MNKILLLSLILLTLFGISTNRVYAWTNGDAGIQKIHQNSVPQLNVNGVYQDHYTSDSFFPLFLYWYDSNRVPEIAAAGFNSLFSADSVGRSYEQQMAILAPYHIKFFPQLFPFIANSYKNNFVDLRNWVAANKNNSNILVWWLTHEMYSSVPNDKWVEAVSIIKSIDPTRRIMGEGDYHYFWTKQCFPFGVTLSYVYDYPIKKSYSSLINMTSGLDLYMSFGCPWPLYVLGQAFYRDTGNWDEEWPVMPNQYQIRGQLYAAIVHGATGVGLFPGFTNQDTGEKIKGLFPGSPQWAAASTANHEIEANKRIFLSKTATDEYHIEFERERTCEYYEAAEGCSPNIHTLLKNTGESGIRYLLAVNMNQMGANTKFTFPALGNISKVTSVFDSRNLAPQGLYFTDTFGGYGARLYKIESAGAPTPTRASIPNCTITSGPSQVTLGQPAVYQANFSSPQGNLGTMISIGQNGTFKWSLTGSGTNNGSSATQTFTWTPTGGTVSPGTYDLFCRAWNDAIAECRGKSNYVDGPPRYLCTGPNSYKTVQVVAPLPTATPIHGPTATPTPVIPHVDGDFTGDGKINVVDFVLFMNYWFFKDLAKGDLNHDGKINAIDYTVFMNFWYSYNQNH